MSQSWTGTRTTAGAQHQLFQVPSRHLPWGPGGGNCKPRRGHLSSVPGPSASWQAPHPTASPPFAEVPPLSRLSSHLPCRQAGCALTSHPWPHHSSPWLPLTLQDACSFPLLPTVPRRAQAGSHPTKACDDLSHALIPVMYWMPCSTHHTLQLGRSAERETGLCSQGTCTGDGWELQPHIQDV